MVNQENSQPEPDEALFTFVIATPHVPSTSSFSSLASIITAGKSTDPAVEYTKEATAVLCAELWKKENVYVGLGASYNLGLENHCQPPGVFVGIERGTRKIGLDRGQSPLDSVPLQHLCLPTPECLSERGLFFFFRCPNSAVNH